MNILWYSKENICVGVSFLIKLQVISPITLLTRDSNTDIFFKHLQCSKTDLSKETEKEILRRDTPWISVAAIWRCNFKKVPLKISLLVYLHFIKIDNNLCKLVKILISEQIAHAVIFYFGQVFVFCRSINKNVLEWFLLIISKKYTLTRSSNLLKRNHSTFCFWFRRGRQMPNI